MKYLHTMRKSDTGIIDRGTGFRRIWGVEIEPTHLQQCLRKMMAAAPSPTSSTSAT